MIRLIAVASSVVLLSGCAVTATSEGPAEFSGTVSTTEQYRMTTDGTVIGLDPKPDPVPTIPDSDAATLCQGAPALLGVRVSGTDHYFFSLSQDPQLLEGRQITITDAGKIVALAELTFDGGTQASGQGSGTGSLACTYGFTITDLKSDADFFTIAIDGVPGTENVSREDLLSGLNLSIG